MNTTDETTPEDFSPGSFGCHEAYHMASVLMTMVDSELCEHPAIKQNDVWAAMAETARKQLRDLYLSISDSHNPEVYQQRAVNYYENDIFEERPCDNPACGKLYRGPAVYCSLMCAEADAA